MEPSKIKKHAWVSAVVIILIAAVVSYFVFVQISITDTEFSNSVENAEQSFNSGNVDLSISELESLLGKDLTPTYRTDVLIALASAYAQKGSLEFKETEYGNKALGAINEALLINPTSSNAYRVMAYAYEIMQNYDKAIPAYEMAISLDATNAMAHSGAGHAYDLMGDIAKAESHLKEAIRLDATLDHALLNLSRIYYKQGKVTESNTFAQKVVGISSNSRFRSEAINIQGANAFGIGDMENAARLFEEASQVDPTLPHNYVSLAQTHMQALLTFGLSEEEITGIAQKSLALIDQAISINSNLTVAHVEKARILLTLNKRDDARAAFNIAAQVVARDISLSATEKEEWAQFITDSIANNKL